MEDCNESRHAVPIISPLLWHWITGVVAPHSKRYKRRSEVFQFGYFLLTSSWCNHYDDTIDLHREWQHGALGNRRNIHMMIVQSSKTMKTNTARISHDCGYYLSSGNLANISLSLSSGAASKPAAVSNGGLLGADGWELSQDVWLVEYNERRRREYGLGWDEWFGFVERAGKGLAQIRIDDIRKLD